MKLKLLTKQSEQGFTLIELMVTIAIAGILLGVGIPSFNAVIKSNRTATQANIWQSTIYYARSEAMKRGGQVRVISADGSTDWSDGWYVYVDTNGNGVFNSGEELRVFEELAGGSSLTSNTSQIVFDEKGFVDGMRVSDTVVWSLTQSDCTGNINRSLTLNQSGRVHVTNVTCSPAL